jgi:two-component system, chemotaxis family, sensor kinase CheA
MFSDVTARVAAERTEAEQRQTLAMFERVMKDRERFLSTFSELRELLGRLHAGVDAVTGKRLLHTLKGNSASIGLGVFSSLCHTLEDELVGDACLSKAQLERLETAFDGLEKWLETMTRDRSQGLLIGAEEYDAMVRAVNDDRHDLSAVRGIVSALQKEPVSRRFEQFADEAQTLAQRLGKGPVQVLVDGGGVRVEKDRFGAFFGSLVHVIRNAIDHGLETPEVRAERRKATPVVRLAAKVSGHEFHVTVADDGSGIDFDALLARARAQGFEGTGVDALFLDGVSSKDEVSSTSGRGIGMSAVKAETERLGGRVAVHSVRGEGSTFTFSFPVTGVSVLSAQPKVELLKAS